MLVDGNTLSFHYDADGKPMSFVYNGTTYYYATNLQGDIVAILSKEGTQVVSYSYDAWGNILSITGTKADTIGKYNPLRYRGYVYDTESKLYYLQSRYYDPYVGRFINADTFATTGQGLLGNNQFAYCQNNPVVYKDTAGNAVETVFDVISLGFSIAEVAANPYDPVAWIGLVGDTIDLIPIVSGVGETVRALRFVDKAGNTFEIAQAVDFSDDITDTLNHLDRSNGFTKSTREAGVAIHKSYKSGPGFTRAYKEYNKVQGIRPDYYDKTTIYELKPYNLRAARAGVRQLQKYQKLLAGSKAMRLEFY